jgi:hypothetical protein
MMLSGMALDPPATEQKQNSVEKLIKDMIIIYIYIYINEHKHK